MPTERIQRRIDTLLDAAEAAIADPDWKLVAARCEAVLAIDPKNEDARADLEAEDPERPLC